jgi:short-subunit dehydrogenase
MAAVTGATSGIGTSFAAVLPRSTGLLLTGRDGARLQALASEHAVDGRRVETLVADLSDASDRRRFIDRAEALGVDLLINNAGFGAFGRIVENDPDTELDIVAVNVTAVVEITRALLPGMLMRAARDGSRAGVIVVASVVAFMPFPMLATYSAAKSFVLSWTETLAEEIRDDPLDVLVLCPGATRTDFFRRAGMPESFLRFAEHPDAVARKGLRALGRRRVLVSRGLARWALVPWTLSRRVGLAGIARYLRRAGARSHF